MTDQLVPRPPRPPGDSAERLSRSLETLIRKSGYQTPEERERSGRLEAERKQRDRLGRVAALRRQTRVYPRDEGAALADVEYVRRRLPDEEYSRYLAVRDDLASLLEFAGIVVMSGDNGTGKTRLAAGLVNGFCDAGRAARWCRAIDFYRELKSTFGEPGRTAMELIRRFEDYQLLVIDEIEVRSDSPWENNELRSLLDARYGRMVSTVLITNKTRAELNGEDGNTPYLSKALRDRIRQDGGILECRWRSLRGEAGGR